MTAFQSQLSPDCAGTTHLRSRRFKRAIKAESEVFNPTPITSAIHTQFGLNLVGGIRVDLFAGGGGATMGQEMATGMPVDIAINHDPDAISMHKRNRAPSTTSPMSMRCARTRRRGVDLCCTCTPVPNVPTTVLLPAANLAVLPAARCPGWSSNGRARCDRK